MFKSPNRIKCSARLYGLALLGLISCQNHFAQDRIVPEISGIHTLSIHVKDTISHDSVYQFLLHDLMLPTYYTPVLIGERRYVGVYAGNMVLEPCGPYGNIDYASDNFRAIFYGMNLEVSNSLKICERALALRGIEHQANKGSIYIRDSILSSDNIFTALYEVNDRSKRDSLQNILRIQENLRPGIECIQEITIALKSEAGIQKWKEYLAPLKIGQSGICQINDSLQLFFVRGEINEVRAITFKVESLEKAEEYFKDRQYSMKVTANRISMDPNQTFGLSLHFSDLKIR